MTLDSSGLGHLHFRKRVHSKKEKYPSPYKKIRMLDKVIYVAGIVGPLMMIPQIIKIFITKDAEGVSLLSYAAFVILSFVWFSYGVVHKEKPIIITHILWAACHITIVVGVLLYGRGFF